MGSTMYEATYTACQEITKTFVMAWALDAGLWKLRNAAQEFYKTQPEATEKQAKDALVKGMKIRGLNLRQIANGLTWEEEEQYISEVLLIYGTAIFDSWVDEFVDTTLLGVGKKKRETFKADLKRGEFQSFDLELAAQAPSVLMGCFDVGNAQQDMHIDNLRLVYKYFKSCRNCCAHKNHFFTQIAEDNYNSIKNLKNVDCGIKEMPKTAVTQKGAPVELILRGVVGFFDVLIRIMKHYDAVATKKAAADEEVKKRWITVPYQEIAAEEKKRISQTRYDNKRNSSIRYHFGLVHMYCPYWAKTDSVRAFLESNLLIQRSK